MSAVKFTRPQILAHDVVVVDGMSSSGKSLISPILSSLSRVQLWQICEWYEYLCISRRLKRVSKDAFDSLLNTFSDLDLYNIMIARRANFRENDLTGVSKNLLLEEYKKRASGPEGDVIVNRIKKQRAVLNLMTHYVYGSADFLFDAWQNRLKLLILPVRHPLWLIEKWHSGNWDRRIGRDPRDVQLCCNANGLLVPWFAASWAKLYCGLKPLERSIATVAWFIDDFRKQDKRLTQNQKTRVLKVPFEYFAAAPSQWIDLFCKKLNVGKTPLTRATMKKLAVPRKDVTTDYRITLNKFVSAAKGEKTSRKSMKIFETLCENYEKEFPNCLAK